MGKVKNAPTPRRAGVSHGIKKPKATAPAAAKKTKVTKKVIDTETPTRKSRRSILAQVENIPVVDQNENLNKKTKQEIKTEDDIKGEIKTENEDDVGEYEMLRQKNIQERQEMFREILDAKKRVSAAFTPPTAVDNKRSVSKRGLATPKREKEYLPPRKSARLAGGQVPEIKRYVPELAPAQEPERNTIPLETLDSKAVFNYGEDLDKLKHAEDYYAKFSSEIQPGKQKTNRSSNEYIEKLKKFNIAPEQVAKVVPDRIFSVAMHPTEHKMLASAGGKWGALGLWDINDKDSAENGVYLFNPHSRPINWQSWDMFNDRNLITTSYDGTCRILDIEKLESRLLYGDEDFIDSSYCTQHQQIDANTFLITKGKTGCVGVVDLRNGHTSTVTDYRLFDRISPKCLSVHPIQTNIICAANNKGGTYIFDIRQDGKGKGAKSASLMEPIAELMGHARSVSTALFNSTGSRVATLSWDDKLRVFDTTTMKGSMRSIKDVRHNNNTGRWLTPFKGHWHPVHEDIYFTGSMAQPRELEAWQVTSSSVTKVHSFRGEDLGSICSVLAVHPTLDILIGGNSSGRVHAFM